MPAITLFIFQFHLQVDGADIEAFSITDVFLGHLQFQFTLARLESG